VRRDLLNARHWPDDAFRRVAYGLVLCNRLGGRSNPRAGVAHHPERDRCPAIHRIAGVGRSGASQLLLRERDMKCSQPFLVLALSMAACAGQDAARRSSWDADMKRELLDRVAADQSVRERMVTAMRAGVTPDSATIAALSAVDSANTAWLRDQIDQHGWPDSSVVGGDAASAMFLLVQHADRDTAFQARVLPALEAAYRRGQAQGQHVALLTDRLATARGEPQVYGTQATMRDGRVIIGPLSDSSSVDAHRATMGLPPLAEYLHVLDSIYAGSATP